MTAPAIKNISKYGPELLRKLSDRFENAAPEDVLKWALNAFGRRIALATGFGAEGCVLVHMTAGIDPSARIFYLDTELLFEETYALKERLESRYGVQIERRSSDLDLEAQATAFGAKLWESRPDRCCYIRKVEPLIETLNELDAWITAIRRDQSPARAEAGIVEWDRKFGLVKINPLARWTSKDVWKFIVENEVPYNPLHDKGYPSIGCRPCTTLVQIGENARDGRWRGFSKTECGLH
jgi:phosphoadenosine phosphosulfate reductase